MINYLRYLANPVLFAGIAFGFVSSASANVYTVVNTSGNASTSGSLPWAVAQANTRIGFDYIDFNISGSGEHFITLNAPLTITDPVQIDGTTQPGYSSSPLIFVQFALGFADTAFSLTSGSSGSTIQGLGIFMANIGISTSGGSNNNYLQHNWIGSYTDPYGVVFLSMDFESGSYGILVQSNSNSIRYNTISGNNTGVFVGESTGLMWSGSIYSGNAISGNFIGTDPTGTTISYYGNEYGVVLGVGANNNYVGPTNIIGGNSATGIQLGLIFAHDDGGGENITKQNVVYGNYVGVGAAGHVLSNGVGVALYNQVIGNVIGGPSGGNIISGNTGDGVDLNGAYENFVQDNLIGLDPTQGFAIGNGNSEFAGEIEGTGGGVHLENNAVGNVVQSNTISGNFNYGVEIEATAISNGVSSNYIGATSAGTIANVGYGIVLFGDYNYVGPDTYGSNTLGNIKLGPDQIGNVIH